MTATLVVCVQLPLRIVSVANIREHWAKRANRANLHRSTTKTLLKQACQVPPVWPVKVTLTRIAPRKLDTDNLSSGFKAVRDGVADWLRIDDGDERLTFSYTQRFGKPKEYAAEVVVECFVQP